MLKFIDSCIYPHLIFSWTRTALLDAFHKHSEDYSPEQFERVLKMFKKYKALEKERVERLENRFKE